ASAALEHVQFLPRLGVPEPDRLVATAGDQAAAVRAESDGPDRAAVSVEAEEGLPGGDVPDPDGVVQAGGREAPAVGAERHRPGLRRVSAQGEEVGPAAALQMVPLPLPQLRLALLQ